MEYATYCYNGMKNIYRASCEWVCHDRRSKYSGWVNRKGEGRGEERKEEERKWFMARWPLSWYEVCWCFYDKKR